jgi:DNA-directed RNA polymerase specialized sigma subunit
MPDKDVELWKQWDQGGRKNEDLQPLFKQFAGTLEREVNQYAHKVNVPPAAIRANVHENFLDAVKAYDPNYQVRGQPVKLNTYVNHHLKKTKRFIAQNQNFARIPEPTLYSIGTFERAEDRLKQKLGRDPTIMDLSRELKWPPAQVERTRKSLRKDLSANMFEVDPSSLQVSRWNEVKALIPYELNSQENAVYELVFNTSKELSNNEIANKLKLSPSRISKIKLNIANKIEQYLD